MRLDHAEQPLVSIVVPAYQAGRFLAETLRSALDQDYPHLEVVVLDNGSTDDTAAVLAAVTDPRLRVARNPITVPLPENWNRAVGLARGEYVKVLCADDLIEPTCVSEQAAVLAARPEVALVASRVHLVDASRRVLRRDRGLSGLVGTRSGTDAVRAVMRSGGNPIGPTAAVLFRRKDFENIGGFDGNFFYPMELELWVRLAGTGVFVGIPRPLAAFRVSDAALTADTPALQQIRQQRELMNHIAADPRWRIRRYDRAVGAVNSIVMQVKRTRLARSARERKSPCHPAR